MLKEIKYSGYTTNPSDYQSPDGALAVSINLIPEDGSLKSILPPKVSSPTSDAIGNCVYIHKNSGYTHYILCADNTDFSWYDKENPNNLTTIGTISKYIKVTSVGNTLIFLTEDGMQYYLWKGGSIGYLHLGSKIPEYPISFGLQAQMVRTDEFSISFDPIPEAYIWSELSDNNKKRITDQVLAHVNKFIAEQSTNKGRFIFPFFVRYAYRLYDGSLTMHSSPVLMIASTDVTPLVYYTHITGKKNYTDATLRIAAPVHSLDFAPVLPSRIYALKNWEDIVRSIDIFVSKPIYTYDQNGKCFRFFRAEDDASYAVCRLSNQTAPTDQYPPAYQPISFERMYALTFDPINLSCPNGCLTIPRKTDTAIKENIRSTNLFYLIHSIKIDQLPIPPSSPSDTIPRKIIDIPEDYLQSLTTREIMTDDYDSHDTLIPHYCFPYNSRLNLSNISKRLYDQYNSAALITHTDGKAVVAIYFYIKQDGKDIILLGESAEMASINTPFLFLFYPNINAYKAVILCRFSGPPVTYEIPLQQHEFLNGAFYFGGWDNPPIGGSYPSPSSNAERTIEIPNKIYTSEVNNPFVFPVLGINTVGTGEIKGICSAAKALSEGQFGQFPLYAFTTEGVWALEVSSTGTYSARQPITRDVCINADGITQLDSAVLFPTDRGIMLISGSQTTCISDAINSEFPFNALTLPGFSKLHDMLGHNPESDKCLPTLPFSEFLKQCKMIYDYVHQRVIVYAPGITYAYVFSLKSKEWGMIFSNIASHLNSYPEALAVDPDNNILNFSSPDTSHDDDGTNGIDPAGLLLTRPLHLDAPDILKTIDTVIQRGNFAKGHVQSVLYGSRDLVNWHLVWSSKDHYLRGFRGTPYKYFRIALICNLAPRESITGASIQFTPRLTNQPR